MLRGTIIFLIGYLGWHIDYHFCNELNKVSNPQLHAWWHLTASYSNYSISLTIMFDRSKMLGKNTIIRWVYNILPYVELPIEFDPLEAISLERALLMQ
ncbi:18091_t:CDS:2 [Funneliformis geosporum]|nr:18091_t:CDS:2 [Funneliformis geosporum]